MSEGEQITVSGGSFRGVNIGGRHNVASAREGSSAAEELASALARVLAVLPAEVDDPDAAADRRMVAEAHRLASEGRTQRASTVLRAVGGWVAGVAERAGARVVADIVTGAL